MANTNLIYPYELEGGKKAVANEVMANFEAVQLVVAGINTEINNLTTVLTELKKKPTREMMDIYYSFSSQAPAGAFPLWTGETLTNAKTLYPQFWKKLNQLADDGAIPTVASEAEYESKVEEFGQCNAFFINTLDGHVRLPKITRFISSIEQLSDIGEYNDTLKKHAHNLKATSNTGGQAASKTRYLGSGTSNSKSAMFWSNDYNLENTSVVTETGEEETYPKHVKLYLYLQVVNNITEISELDVEVIANQLNAAIAELETKKNECLSELETTKEVYLAELKNWVAGIDEDFYTKAEVDTKIEAIPSLYNRITNCITEIPQDIKLELNNGTLTLKAGSKTRKASGVNSFVEVNITSDSAIVNGWGSASSGMVFYGLGSGYNYYPFERLHSGATNPTGLSGNSHINYNTTDGYFYYTTTAGSTWTKSTSGCLPLACVTWSSDNKVTSIDQVFNGFGFIGSTVFASPGIKGLIPNGRNEDGTLKSAEFVTPRVFIDTSVVNSRAIYVNASGVGDGSIVYNDVENLNYWGANVSKSCIAGEVVVENGKITSFQPKLPFRAVDYNELEKIIGDIDSILDEINGEVL
jgi:hypothetical protein